MVTQWMRLTSAADDVTEMTSQPVTGRGSRLTDIDTDHTGGRWRTTHTQSDQYVSVLTITNATQRDAGLVVCYYATDIRRSPFHVFHLTVTDDESSVIGE